MAFQFQVNFGTNGAVALSAANRALLDMTDGLDKGAAASKRFDVEWGNVVHSIAGFRLDGGKLVFNLAEGIGAVANAARAAFSAVTDLGKSVIKTVAETQDINLAIKLNVGAENAGAIQKLADTFSAGTRFDDDVFKKLWLPLLNQGVSDTKILGDMTAAAVDFAMREGTGAAGLGPIMDAFQQLTRKGAVDERALKRLSISSADYYDALAEGTGLARDAVEAASKNGGVAGEDQLYTVLQLLAKRSGGALGLAGAEGRNTLGGTLERLENLPGNILKQLDGTEGMQRLHGVLESLVETMSGETGHQLASALASALEAMTKPAVIAGVTALMGAMTAGIAFLAEHPGTLQGLAIGFVGVAGAVAALGAALVVPVYAIARLGMLFGDVIWMAKEMFGDVLGVFPAIGRAVVEGFKNGLSAGWESLKESLRNLANDAVLSVKVALGIASPSRVFAELGEYTGEGFALGLEGSADRIALAAREAFVDPLAVPDVRMNAAGSNGGQAAGLAIGELHIHVGDRRDARAAGREAADGFVERVSTWLDESRLSWGGGVA